MELTGATSGAANHCHVFPVAGEFLDAVVAQFADVDKTLLVDFDGVRVSQLAGLTAFAAPCFYEPRRRLLEVENLNAVIGGVGDPKLIFFIHEQSLRSKKRSGFFPVTADLTHGFSGCVKFLNSIEVTVFSDVVVTGRILDDVREKSKLPQTASCFSTNVPLGHHFPFGRIEQDLEIVRVGHHQQPVVAEAHPAWFAVDACGRSPGPDKFSVAVEDLNAAGFVDDEEVVGFVNGDCARFDKSSVVEPFFAPDVGVAVEGSRRRHATGKQQPDYERSSTGDRRALAFQRA